MLITVTDYLDVISSWCFWSEPTWAELKKRYGDRVKFQWKIALMDPSGLPASREQEQWFYRRSGMMMRSPFMLNTDWYDPSLPEWLAANYVAEAGGIDTGKLLEHARSEEIEQRVRASTAEFHALQVSQRPTFVIDTEIGDRAVFSGVVKFEPLAATIDSMLDDATVYAAHKAHFGEPPKK